MENNDVIYGLLPRALLGSSLLLAVTARGDWSSDHVKNLVIADVAGALQVQPKIVPSTDKSWYVSWFKRTRFNDSSGDNAVVLQRLSQNGDEVFPHNGIRVSRLGRQPMEDFSLDTDAAGNALLAFPNDHGRPEDPQITVAKISPSGQALWGDLGVRLTTRSASHYPKVIVTNDGGVVVGWTTEDQVILQKLDAEGQPLWTRTSASQPGVVLSEAGFRYILSDMHASDNGSVIINFHRLQGEHGAKHLYANKIAADGKLLWGKEHVKIFDGGSLYMGVGESFVSDGNGGAIFTWFSWRPRLQGFVQHILADGSKVFRHNGEALSTNTQQYRSQISVSYRADTKETFLFWQELAFINSERRYGVYGQKIGANGDRQWGDNGLVIVPIGSSYLTDIKSAQTEDGVFAFWTEDSAHQESKRTVQGIKLDHNGKVICSQFPVSSTPSQKANMAIGVDPSGRQVALAWQDNRNADEGDQIHMQNVNRDCSLGVKR